MKIAIIGLGRMGQSIREGLLKSSSFCQEDLFCSKDKLHNCDLVQQAELVILALEPEIVPLVLQEIKGSLNKNKVVISVAARVSLEMISSHCPPEQALVRVMPNICAAVGESMSCWTAKNLTVKQTEKVSSFLRALGQEVFLQDEKLFDAITAISGSGPAYIFLLAELMQAFANDLGLEPNLSKRLVNQVLLGSSKMLIENSLDPSKLKARVASKGGTTEAALQEMRVKGFDKIFLDALHKAKNRASHSLGDL